MNTIVQLMRGVEFATRKHSDQRRKGENCEPYINHVAEVASLLAESTGGEDAVLVLAGLLHDTVEDTGTTPDEIEKLFGREVRDLVIEVTDDKTLPKKIRKMRQVENAPSKSRRARMLKLADKTSNLRAIVSSPPVEWDRARKLEYFEWAKAVADSCRGLNPGLEAAFDEAYAAGLACLTGPVSDVGP